MTIGESPARLCGEERFSEILLVCIEQCRTGSTFHEAVRPLNGKKNNNACNYHKIL